MESIRTIWNLFLFFSMLALPQLLGVLAYFRIRRRQALLAHLAGFLIPPALYFYLSWLFFVYVPRQGQIGEEGCGMAAVAAAFIVILGTGAQIIVSLIAQLLLRLRQRTSLASK
jgi:hypothetical protein